MGLSKRADDHLMVLLHALPTFRTPHSEKLSVQRLYAKLCRMQLLFQLHKKLLHVTIFRKHCDRVVRAPLRLDVLSSRRFMHEVIISYCFSTDKKYSTERFSMNLYPIYEFETRTVFSWLN